MKGRGMLHITVPPVPGQDLWDEKNEIFITQPAYPGEELLLEHSLASLSKWEQITEKAFLGKEEKTREETIEYIKCMCISPVNHPDTFKYLTGDNFNSISAYIDRKMTATTFHDIPGARSSDRITAEIVYYWIVALQIPMEAQYWHLNKLIALVRVVNLKNQPEKKQRATRSFLAERKALNAQRRAEMGTSG